MASSVIEVFLAALLALTPSSTIDHFCITATVFGEARSESEIGQALVAQTILNRTADERWPTSPCAVVAQPRQFAGYAAAWPTRVSELREWRLASEIAAAVQAGAFRPGSCGLATHFHTAATRPAWSRSMRRLCRVDNHIFYLEKQR